MKTIIHDIYCSTKRDLRLTEVSNHYFLEIKDNETDNLECIHVTKIELENIANNIKKLLKKL